MSMNMFRIYDKPCGDLNGGFGMSAIRKILAILTGPDAPLDVFKDVFRTNAAPPAPGRNSTRTKGRKFASQNERANRRKARAKK